jgi:uncharacterized protein YqhQ
MDNPSTLPTYGGQAVIEGVMMRGRQAVAIAMRAPDQQIRVHTEPLGGIYHSRLAKLPFLRGLVMLWDALGLGIKALAISANIQAGEKEKVEGLPLVATLILSLTFAVALFFLTPAAIGHLSERYLVPVVARAFTAPAPVEAGPAGLNSSSPQSSAANSRGWFSWWGNLIEGIVRLLILIGYIWIVGQVPDIQRVFAYHGAEHKTINAFEAGVELTPENAARFSLEHPRCGTAFLLTLVILSVVVFSLLGPLPVALRLISRILFLPLLAGMAYEYIRWTARHLHRPWVRWLIRPNLALQRLTTREPSLDMLEVAIAAFKHMRAAEGELRL